MTTGRLDYQRGVDKMLAVQPVFGTPEKRYDDVVCALEHANFSGDELRGMLSIALDRIKQGGY